MNNTKSDRQNKYPTEAIRVQSAFKELLSIYKEPTQKLVNHLYFDKHYTLAQIGELLGVSKQAIKLQYLTKGEKKWYC